jgi:hypothetical protein
MMGRIKLRVWGMREDLETVRKTASESPDVVSVSGIYPNRPPSKECRLYIEIDVTDQYLLKP